MRAGVIALAAAMLFALAVSCGHDERRNRAAVTEPSVSPSATTIPEHEAGASNRVALFGTAASFDGGILVVEMPPAVVPGREPPVRRWIPVPGLGDVAGKRVRVAIDDATTIQIQDGGSESVPPGTPVMVAGVVSGDRVLARLVADMRIIDAYFRSPEAPALPQIEGTWRELAPDELPAILPPPGSGFAGERAALQAIAVSDRSQTLEFKGEIDSPLGGGWNSGSLFIPISTMPGLFLKSIAVKASVGGGHFNFPFTFDLDSPAPLFVDSNGLLDVSVTPKEPDGGATSYDWLQGVLLTVKVTYWGLDFSQDVGEAQSFEMTDAAPMPGETIEVPHPDCLKFQILKIKDLPSPFEVRVCLDQTFHGEPFGVDTLVVDGSTHPAIEDPLAYFKCPLFGGEPGNWELKPEWPFDGTTPLIFPVRPSTNPLTVDLRGFLYRPTRDLGMSLELSFLGHTYFDTPTLTLTRDGCENYVPPDQEDCPPYLGSGTCGEQPKMVSLALPVIPVVTSVTATPYLSRVGDTVVLEALVRGANGPGLSPREVSFYDDDALLGVAPIDGADVAKLSVSTLSPCRHEIRAVFIGMDDEGTAYPSEKSTLALVTGDADMARSEGYWQHQMKGNGAMAYEAGTLSCYLAVAGELSAVFGERRDATTTAHAHDVLFLRQNHGSALEQLDRELLVAWLNVASGGLRWDHGVDLDRDGIADVSCMDVLNRAESVRLDPSATESDCLRYAQIVHTMKAMAPDGPGMPETQVVPGNKQRPGEVTSGF